MRSWRSKCIGEIISTIDEKVGCWLRVAASLVYVCVVNNRLSENRETKQLLLDSMSKEEDTGFMAKLLSTTGKG